MFFFPIDGISVYDPPEKIIPRWKGPPIEEISAFLRGGMGQEKSIAENSHISELMKHKDSEFLEQSKASLSSSGCEQNTRHHKSSKTSRTVIEGSDGSIKAGKKSGKEFWQHTKKWSQGFLDSYNAETDPEVKAVMKDIGKDLDRWITEKEIKEAGDLMDKLPVRGQKIIKEKLDRFKREIEMFGPHAVVSKYREYADEPEPDYLWWLDLPYILVMFFLVDNVLVVLILAVCDMKLQLLIWIPTYIVCVSYINLSMPDAVSRF